MSLLRRGLIAGLALGLGIAACQAYNMEEVDPQTIVAVETYGNYVRSSAPSLLVVQDRSLSMDICFEQAPFPGQTRGCETASGPMDPTRRSRMEVAQDVMQRIVDANRDAVRFGLVLYGVDPTLKASCGPPSTVAEPGVDSSAAVAEAYRTHPAVLKPGGGTPTTEGLRRAYEILVDPETNRPKDSARPTYVVLVTDGLMNCNAAHAVPCTCASEAGCPTGRLEYGEHGMPRDPIMCLDDEDAIAQVTRLEKAGVRTFVIGLGDAFGGQPLAANVLNELAEAGGVPQAGAQKFYSAADPAQLQSSLESIIKQIAAPCDYVLDGPVCDGRLVKVALRIGDEMVPTACAEDPGDSTWFFAKRGDGSLDPQRILFSPALCNRLGEAEKVEISIRGVENACEGGVTVPACSLATEP